MMPFFKFNLFIMTQLVLFVLCAIVGDCLTENHHRVSRNHHMKVARSTSLPPVVKTLSGPIRGREYALNDGRVVDMFLGIPYAEPFSSSSRFKKPQSVKPWTEVLSCVQFGPRCPQQDFPHANSSTVHKDEAHCLTLNVFAPRWRDKTGKGFAVMVWIHGGAFSSGSSSEYGDKNIAKSLCDKDVVVVTINYRLGALGFFTTGDELCRGNMGLWDQTLALQWIHDNIRAFGGNPHKVTVFGQSAGGGSADLLAISPHSRDLFQMVIPMAGSGESNFMIRTNEAQAQLGREFARYIGWDDADNNTLSLLNFMEAQPSPRLEVGMGTTKLLNTSIAGDVVFLPNFDGDFFPRPIDELRRESPRKHIMTGTTANEGLLFAAIFGFPNTVEGFRQCCQWLIREYDYGNDAEDVRQKIYDFYMKGVSPNDTTKIMERLVQLLGDFMFNQAVARYAEEMSEYGNNVYFYCFEYNNPNTTDTPFPLPYKGATHGSELRFLLGEKPSSAVKPSQDDREMLDIMTTFFTNFAKYGNPCGEQPETAKGCPWPPYNPAQPYRYMRIELPVPVMANNYQNGRMEFWNTIIQKDRSRAKIEGRN